MKDLSFDANKFSQNLKRKFRSGEGFLIKLEDELKEVLREVKGSSGDSVRIMASYLYSYPSMLHRFQKLNTMNEHDLVGALFMVYGWMPSILRLNSGKALDSEKVTQVLTFLPRLQGEKTEEVWRVVDEDLKKMMRRKETDPKKGNLQTLKDMLGGSVVGLSKVLHFVNPSVFPIYDSNIARCFGDFKEVESYVNYAKCFEEVGRGFYCKEEGCKESDSWKKRMEDDVSDRVKFFEEEFGYRLTPIRAMEFLLFREARDGK